jgi:hypothetical protein
MDIQKAESGSVDFHDPKYKVKHRPEFLTVLYDWKTYKQPMSTLKEEEKEVDYLISKDNLNDREIERLKLLQYGYFSGKLIYIDNEKQVQIYHSKVYRALKKLISVIYNCTYHGKYLIEFSVINFEVKKDLKNISE